MAFEITLSSKGQIVIPKDVRDALGLAAGDKLVLHREGSRILIEPPEIERQTISYAEFRRRIPAVCEPAVPVEHMTDRIGELFSEWRA